MIVTNDRVVSNGVLTVDVGSCPFVSLTIGTVYVARNQE